MKIKLTIAVVTLILLLSSSLSWAQDITPFSLITVTPKSSDNQNIKYSVTFTNTAKKIHLEVPAIYSTDEINSSMPPFAKTLDKVSFTVKLKRINATGVASYTTIGKYKYVIPVINSPGTYSKALATLSSEIGFKAAANIPTDLNNDDLIFADIYAKNIIEQLLGHSVSESSLNLDSSSQAFKFTAYQITDSSGHGTQYSSSADIIDDAKSGVLSIFGDIKDGAETIFNKTKKVAKTAVVVGLVLSNIPASATVGTVVAAGGAVLWMHSVVMGTNTALIQDLAYSILAGNDDPATKANFLDTASKFINNVLAFGVLSDSARSKLNKDALATYDSARRMVDNLSKSFDDAGYGSSNFNSDKAISNFAKSNTADFDSSKITNSITPPTEFVGITSFSPTAFVVGQKATLTFVGQYLVKGMRLTLDDCKDIVELPDGTATQRQFSCTFTSAGRKSGVINGTNITMTVSEPPVQEPVITSYLPGTATLNKLTTFTFTGTDLVAGMQFTLDGCNGITELANGSATQRQFSCTPTSSGEKTGILKTSATNSNTFAVTVTEPASTNNSSSTSGKCVTKADYINKPEYAGTWKEGCYDIGGKMTGVWNGYSSDGMLSWTDTYSNGKRNGLSTNYSSGLLYSKGNFVNDLQDGDWFHYSYTGKVSWKDTYVNGERISTVYY